MRNRDQQHLIEQVGADLRGMMSWISQGRAVEEQNRTDEKQHIQARFGNLDH